MVVRRSFRVGDDPQHGDESLEISLPISPAGPESSLYPVPKFSNGDGGDLESIFRSRFQPASKVEDVFLAADDDIGIQDYFHLFSGSFRVRREACRSKLQAFDSLSVNLALARIAARSRPKQTFRYSVRVERLAHHF
jgi:hypothetical protein